MFKHIITATQLLELSQSSTQSQAQVLVFDCRHDLMQATWGRAQYDTAHLPQAHFAALDDDLSAPKTGHNGRHPLPDRATFIQWLAVHGATPDVQIVCYDQQEGMYAARLWWMCRWAGLANVAVLEGGYAAWLAVGGMVTQDLPSKAPVFPTQLLTLPPLEHVITAQHVLDNLQVHTLPSNAPQLPRFALIDARAPERYRGEVEPLDAVAGHIPNAINRVFKLNIDAQGQFVADLAEQWQAVSTAAKGLPLAHQCGSGVTACHNILALHVAGVLKASDASRLYAGSWSEWCSDLERPVSKG
jgi:thiosulfate/3-mercaptopyruvate sulfurtransferase